ELATVMIVAPHQERSAVGHGITMHQPLRAIPVANNDYQWLVNGTPADCVKLALEHLIKENIPDLIISGINHGPNLGSDILYSGTVSAAVEGSFYKIPSIAVSLSGYKNFDFTPAAAFIGKNLHELKKLATHSILNVNFPTVANIMEYQGVRFTELGVLTYQNVIVERKDPRGQIYFWIGGEPVHQDQTMDSDIKAIDGGFISITPLQIQLTDREFLVKFGTIPSNLSIS
ncbi:MAG TPA: 5'/3'-nucleotidase SurE, partial [Firmicutes bacterium]|nr:5'/3'-nucleotidase SurE [Bacillota bacterium]